MSDQNFQIQTTPLTLAQADAMAAKYPDSSELWRRMNQWCCFQLAHGVHDSVIKESVKELRTAQKRFELTQHSVGNIKVSATADSQRPELRHGQVEDTTLDKHNQHILTTHELYAHQKSMDAVQVVSSMLDRIRRVGIVTCDRNRRLQDVKDLKSDLKRLDDYFDHITEHLRNSPFHYSQNQR